MTKRQASDERQGPGFWVLLVALLLLPAIGLLAPGAQAEDEEPAGTATEEEAPDTEEPTEAKAELPWVADVAAAKAQAAAENKDLFINFTGSDWCGWCKKLDGEVFEHAEFVDAATKDFVFLFLDFPKAADLKAKVVDAKLNDELNAAYGVQGFPTIILATADGTPYARTGYQKGGPESYLTHLEELRQNRAAIQKLLDDATHADVEALKAAFPIIAENSFLGWPSFDWTLAAAEKADPNGDLELLPIVKKEQKRRLAQAEEQELMALLPKQRGEALDYDKVLPFLLGTQYMEGRQFLGLCLHVSEWLMDPAQNRPEEAKQLLEHIAADPLFASVPQAKAALDEFLDRANKMVAGEDEEPADEEEPADDDTDDDEDDADEMDAE